MTQEINTDEEISALCEVLSKAQDPQLLKDFFGCLFTKSELFDIAKRWLLVQEIQKGTPQREIAKMFSMSLCKITRGSRELKKPESAFVKMLEIARK